MINQNITLEAGESTDRVFAVFSEEEYNLNLIPRGVVVGQGCRASTEIVRLRPPVQQGNKNKYLDYYPVEGNLGLSATGVSKIAMAAEIKFLATQIDKREDKGLASVTCQAHAVYRKPSGEMLTTVGSKRWDYDEDREEMEASGKLSKEWLAKRRKFALERTETGAKFRAILSLFGLDHAFANASEAEKPIVVLHTQLLMQGAEIEAGAIHRILYGSERRGLESGQIQTVQAEVISSEPNALPPNTLSIGEGETTEEVMPKTIRDPEIKALVERFEEILQAPGLESKYVESTRRQIRDLCNLPSSADPASKIRRLLEQAEKRLS